MDDETPSSESLIAISTLKSSALQFGRKLLSSFFFFSSSSFLLFLLFLASTLQQIDCPVLHLTGETYMFSLHEVGDFVSYLSSLY